MASSNIKLFDENKGNMLSDSEFSISNQRMNGLQTGIASSQLQNKAMYQASLVAYAIAQVMMQNGKNANDTDAVSAFVANLSGTMLQKVYDIATTAEAQAGVATGKWMSPALVKAAIDTLAAKAQNILSNETKASLGLSNDAVPDDALAILSKAVQYSWFRRVNRDSTTEVKTQYTVSSSNGWNEMCCSLQLSSTAVSAVQYSETVAFDADGTPYLKNPKTVNVSYDNYTAANIISGKYFYKNSKGSVITSRVYYAEPGQDASRYSSNGAYSVYFSKTSIITGIPTNETGDWERLFSDNRNAYPTGIVDGYEYVFVDTILTYSGAPMKIGTISYTGAGNKGDKSIVFPIGPKIIFISRSDSEYAYFPYVWGTPVLFGINATSSSFNKVSYDVSLRGTTLTASGSSSKVHGLDASGVVYTITYIA